MRSLACLTGIALALALPRAAFAIGEVIRDIRVEDNARTEEETVRSIAGIAIGDIMEVHTLETVRERLNTSGLFSDVNVYWVPYRDGVRVNIVIRDKFPWAPVPTLSYAPGNLSAGLVVAHGNLFGRGKRGIIGGRISTADSGALVAYQDPALFQTWMFYQFAGAFQDQTIPEYSNMDLSVLKPVRETNLRTFGFNAKLGVAWFRRVKTSIGWGIDRSRVRWVRGNDEAFPGSTLLPTAADGGLRGLRRGRADLRLSGPRARGHVGQRPELQPGSRRPPLGRGSHASSTGRRGPPTSTASASFDGTTSSCAAEPIWGRTCRSGARTPPAERTCVGSSTGSLRATPTCGRRSSTTFPCSASASWTSGGCCSTTPPRSGTAKLPELDASGQAYLERADGRRFLPPEHLTAGFNAKRDVHTSVGAGLRFFLRSVAVPLVGRRRGLRVYRTDRSASSW